jgi:nitrate reductase gamma subunit
MNSGQILLWLIFPYTALAVFIAGHWWRYKNDQFRWTSRSSQLLDRRILGWASPLFHYGALAAIGGHVIGMFVTVGITNAIGIPESFYRWFAGVAGGVAALACVIGLGGLLFRRLTSDRIRGTTTTMDLLSYSLLTAMIVMGTWMTFGFTLFTHHPENYRLTIAVWWRSLFYLDPNVGAATAAPLLYQVHAILAWAFWAAFPFGRLVHAWSIPLQYLGRPYILYRRRFPAAPWSTRGAPYRSR